MNRMAKHARSPSDEETLSRGAKRRRASVATKPPPCALAPWADLPDGPAGAIAERALANHVSDYVSFRAVCRAWRRATPRPRAQGCLDRRFYPHGWIILREAAPPGAGRHRRRFLNICTGQCVQTELPELEGHHEFGATSEGLLVLLDEASYVVRLLNPATRQLAELPTLDPLLPPETRVKISEYSLAYALKVTGLGLVGDGDDCALAMSFFTPRMLVVARRGDSHWTLVDSQEWFYSAMSFSGRFYCANKARAVMALELEATTATTKQPTTPRLAEVAAITCRVSLMCRDTVHLVESGGRLLLLRRRLESRGKVEDESYCWIRAYKAYAVDFAAGKTVPIHGLPGRRAVFLGKTRALSVSPRVFPSIRGNKVYPAADSWEMSEKGIGSYSLLSGRIERCNVRRRRNDDNDDDDDDNGWTRPCRIRDYLSWYVSGRCNGIEEI